MDTNSSDSDEVKQGVSDDDDDDFDYDFDDDELVLEQQQHKQQDLQQYRSDIFNAAAQLPILKCPLSSAPSVLFDAAISTWHGDDELRQKTKRLTPPEAIALSVQYYGTPSRDSAADEWQNFVKWRACSLDKVAFCEIVTLVERCGGAKRVDVAPKIKECVSFSEEALTPVVSDFVRWARGELHKLEMLERHVLGQLPPLRETQKWERGMFDEAENVRRDLWGENCRPPVDVSGNVPILSQHDLSIGNLCVLVSLQMALANVCAPASETWNLRSMLALSKEAMSGDGYVVVPPFFVVVATCNVCPAHHFAHHFAHCFLFFSLFFSVVQVQKDDKGTRHRSGRPRKTCSSML